jgi:hypothetical protein
MAGTVSVRTAWDRAAIAALETDPEIAAYTEAAARGFAAMARALAPKDTGAGAASIAARVAAEAPGQRDVGWDKPHSYMSFQNNYATLGSRTNPNYRFALDALERYVHV